MKGKWFGGIGVLLVFGFICGGCTSVSGNVESALAFSRPIPIDGLIIGSFSYNINDSYIVCPDGSLIIEPAYTERSKHEAYYQEAVLDNNGNQRLDSNGKPMIRTTLKNEYHLASYDELYLWAVRRAAEKAGITTVIAVKSFVTTTTKNVAGLAISRQDITLTVYGEASAMAAAPGL
ncbi:MAG: hypothetical protein LBG95_00355 [Treponema sp.]|nr:hypothetical protein [Treponema sp.]